MKKLKYKNDILPGYFIDYTGKIYDENGVEQKQKLSRKYLYFKRHAVHKMMVHSFYGYKEGYDVHHKNEVKTDNRLQNLVYLTHAEHTRLHKKKQVYCVELNKVFDGIRIAAKELSLYHDSICRCCQGKRKTTGGFHFEYYLG